MNTLQLNGIIRHLITAAGGAGFAISQDEILKLLSAMATVLGILWSWWEKRRSDGAPVVPKGPLAAVAGLMVLAPFLVGCQTAGGAGGAGTVVTPRRVQAVATLGSYFAAKERIQTGHRDEVVRVYAGLAKLKEVGSSDLMAVGLALQAAGIEEIDSPEGRLVWMVAVNFEDFWDPTGKAVLDSSYGVAVRDGCLVGIEMALADTAKRGGQSSRAAALSAEAEATRPGR